MKHDTILDFVYQAQIENTTDMMIVTRDKEDNVQTCIVGEDYKIAEALHSILYDKNHSDEAELFYNMIKNIVCNIVHNDTPLKQDMLNMMQQLLNESTIEKENPNSKVITMPFLTNQLPS